MIAGVRCFILLFSLSQATAAQNSSFADKMHQIYKSSYQTEVDDAEWSQYIASIGVRQYQVRGGDTLWDLSTVFFGDGHYWSKIWSYNSSLTNPHLIRVGQTIEFFSGSIETPPGFTVGGGSFGKDQRPKGLSKDFKLVKKDSQMVDLNQASSQQSNLFPGAPGIPPPRQGIRPVRQVLPNSFKDEEPFDESSFGIIGISMDVRPVHIPTQEFVAQSFFYSGDADDYPRIGDVIEPEEDHIIVGNNNLIYVKSETGLEIGGEYTLMGKEYDFEQNGVSGDIIRYLGQVKITDKLEDNNYRGMVHDSLGAAKPGSWITKEAIPVFKNNFEGRPMDKKLPLVGGGATRLAQVFSHNDTVFIGGGSRDGLRVGDIVGVYKRRDIRYREPEIKVSPTPIGHLKIYRADPKVATAYVVGSIDALIAGDVTGAPAMVSGVSSQFEKADLNDIETDLDVSDSQDALEESSLDDELEQIEIQ